MNVAIVTNIVLIIVIVVMLVMSITLLMGKGSFLIAGYNTATVEEKAKYNEELLCRIIGAGLLLISIIFMTLLYHGGELPNNLNWLIPYGLFAVVVTMLILSSTVAKKK
jgi:hypothetical protein